MIKFDTIYLKIYNKIINNALIVSRKSFKGDIGEIIDRVMPNYLRREDYISCKHAFEDLLNWSDSLDGFWHDLDQLHSLSLYKYLKYLENKQNKTKTFSNKYFSKNIKEEIDKIILQNKLEGNNQKAEELNNNFYNIKNYYKVLFKDLDFLNIEKLHKQNELLNEVKRKPKYYQKYFQILPLNIRSNIKVYQNSLTQEIEKLLKFINKSLKEANLAHMFWQDNQQMNETQIQIALNSIINSYFKFTNLDINRESSVGNGDVDFKFYRENETIIFEIKKASNPKLNQGYETQIVKYMKSLNCKKAYYIIFCFTDKDIIKANDFIKCHSNKNEYNKKIQIIICDVRKTKPILTENSVNINKDISKQYDTYINYIYNINTVKTKEEILDYFHTLKSNYEKIYDEKIKERYFQAIQGIEFSVSNITGVFKHLFSVKGPGFYKIISKENSIKDYAVTMFKEIKNYHTLNFVYKIITDQFSGLSEFNPITQSDINNVFENIKQKQPYIYKYLSSLFIDIYIFDKSCPLDYYEVISLSGNNWYIITCLSNNAQNNLYKQLGVILWNSLIQKFQDKIITKIFKKEKDFVNDFANYFIDNNSKNNKDINLKLNKLSSELRKELKYDCISND